MDYEYSDEPLEGRVLWGRAAVYGVAFVLVFLLGNCLGSRGGPSDEELDRLSEQVTALAAENADLEQQLAAATAGRDQDQTGGTGGQTDGTTSQPTEPPAEQADDDEGEGDGETSGEVEVYTVRAGDSLYRIASQFYGDGTKWRLIAEANGLDDDNRLTVGQELRIPPED